MDITQIRLLGVGGLLVVGIVTVAGALAASFLAAWLIDASLAVAAWIGRIRGGPAKPPAARADRARAIRGSPGFDAGAEHVLLARQAWWRLRC